MYLTKRQKEILDYIAEYLGERGYAPTLEEIGEHFGLSSPATVYKHVQRLVSKGYLRKTRHQGRGIEMVDSRPERTIEVAMIGNLRPGRRIDPVRPPELVALPPSFRGRAPLFMLRVLDGHPDEPSLVDGDLLVLEERTVVRDGETVLALLAGQAPAIGICRRNGDELRLRTGGGTDEILGAPRDEIRGVLVGLIRRYR